MEDPCHNCLVKSCCIEYCEKRCEYNRKVKELYLNNKNKCLFEQAVDDVIRRVSMKYCKCSISRDDVKRFILSQ